MDNVKAKAAGEALLEAGHVNPLLPVLGEAFLLQLRKAADYQGAADRDVYFPLGLASHATILNMKAQRLVSLSVKSGAPTYESARDTALDLINYASFLVEWLDRHK